MLSWHSETVRDGSGKELGGKKEGEEENRFESWKRAGKRSAEEVHVCSTFGNRMVRQSG